MASSLNITTSERMQRSFSADGNNHSSDGNMHHVATHAISSLLAIPEIRHVLRRIIEQRSISPRMLSELRDGARNAGVHQQIFFDLVLIALGPQQFPRNISDLQSIHCPNKQTAHATAPSVIHPPHAQNEFGFDEVFRRLETERLFALVQEEAMRENQDDVSDLFDSQHEEMRKQYPSELRDSLNLIELCLRDAGQAPLLGKEKEQELFQQLEAAREQHDEERIRNLTAQIVSANMRFAIHVAKKYQNRGLNFLDLIQEAYSGLLEAVEGFEWQQGTKFVTYAHWWVFQRITRAITHSSHTIRFPIHVHEKMHKLGKTFYDYVRQQSGRMPTDEELAATMKWDIDKVKEMRLYLRQQWTSSLDAPVWSDSYRGDLEDTTQGEFIADASATNPEDVLIEISTKKQVKKLVSNLPPREEEIIRRRFGIDTGEPETLEQISQSFGLTRERIRQLEKQAMARLQRLAATMTDKDS